MYDGRTELCERQGEEDGLTPDKILGEGAAIQLEVRACLECAPVLLDT